MTENLHNSNNSATSRCIARLYRLGSRLFMEDSASSDAISTNRIRSHNTGSIHSGASINRTIPTTNPDKLVQTTAQKKKVQDVIDRTTNRSINHPQISTSTQATICSNITSTMLNCIGVSSNRKGYWCMLNILLALVCYQLDNNFSDLAGNSKQNYNTLLSYGLRISYHTYIKTVKYLSSGMYIHYPLLSHKNHSLKFRNAMLVRNDYHFSAKYHSFYKQYSVFMIIGDTVKSGYLFKVVD